MAKRYKMMDVVLPAALMTAAALLLAVPAAQALARRKDFQIVEEGNLMNHRYQIRHKDGMFFVFYEPEGTSGMVKATVNFFWSVFEANEALFDILVQKHDGSPCRPMDAPPEYFDCFEDSNSPTGFSLRMIG